MAARRRATSLVLVLLALLTALPATGQPLWQQRYDAYGTMLVRAMAAAPFPHNARADGYRYGGQLYSAADCYSDSSVAVFVPEGFRAGATVDAIVHCHGWRGRLEELLPHYLLAEQLVASRRNAVLIVPQGPRGAPDSFAGRLEEPGGFARLMAEVLALLREQAVIGPDCALGRLILSAHSGGGRAVARMLDVGGLTSQVREVWLFDAMYGMADSFLGWWDQQQGRLVSLYTADGGTLGQNEALMARLTARRTPCLALRDDEASPAWPRSRQPVFVRTNLAHDDVMTARNTFRALAESSLLDPVPTPDGPPHLRAAWQLLNALDPTDTYYRHGEPEVSFGPRPHLYADCSGFVDALYTRAYGWSTAQFESAFGSARPTARRLYDGIVAGKLLSEVRDLRTAQPGDLLAAKFLDPSDNTGHVMLVAGRPRRVPDAAPIQPGTEQWALPIIDATSSAHGPSDTRRGQGVLWRDATGLGAGVFRLYGDAAGAPVGYAWSMTSTKYCPRAQRPLVIGRVR